MDVKNNNKNIGSLYISTSVIEKVSKLAALEIDGVADVSTGSSGVKGIFAKTNLPKAVDVNMCDGVAEVDIHIIVKYGCKVPAVCKNVQESVKSNIQNMTEVTVSKVNVIVAGIQADN